MHEFVDDNEIVKVVLSGIVGLSDFLEIIKELEKSGRHLQPRLWDLRQCDFEFDGEDVRTLADAGRAIDQNPTKIAVLTDSDFVYATTRVHTAFRSGEGVEQRVFRDYNEAISWLRE